MSNRRPAYAAGKALKLPLSRCLVTRTAAPAPGAGVDTRRLLLDDLDEQRAPRQIWRLRDSELCPQAGALRSLPRPAALSVVAAWGGGRRASRVVSRAS